MAENESNVDESIDINLRPIDEIVRRAVLLLSLVRRAAIEPADPSSEEDDAFERETDRFELYSWAKREFADTWAEDEHVLLSIPAGELLSDHVEHCLSAAPPANALCWSLGVVDDLTSDDIETLPLDHLLNWASTPWDEVGRLARKASLRDEERIAQMRERWELWYWRATLDDTDLDPGEDLGELVGDVAAGASESDLVNLIDADFGVDGQPFRSIDADQQATIAQLAEHNLIALNWVCGFGDSWESVPHYPD